MDSDERKSRLHIHLGGLVIVIIIILILFKVDIKSKIQSPQFQENISYIEGQVKTFWQKYILGPIKSKTGSFFIDMTNKSFNKIKNNITDNLIKNETTQN